jgi:drug/metabolite transporter (DMT)-like permease
MTPPASGHLPTAWGGKRSHQLGAFAAMLFVGVTWGVNLPVTKVMLSWFDLVPLATLRTAVSVVTLGVLLWLVEGRRALAIDVGLNRFLMLGLLMAAFFALYAGGLQYSNPITVAAVQVAGPLVSAVTVRVVTGQRFDPGFGVALVLSLVGGLILTASSLAGAGHVTLGGGEIVVLSSNVLWTLYSLKAQAWFDRESQLHRAYVASLSALGWLLAVMLGLIAVGWSRSPWGVCDPWIWTQLIGVAVLSSGIGSYAWNVGASRLGVAIASLWANLVPFFAVLWAMVYGFMPNGYQIAGGLVALSGVVYMQARKLRTTDGRP